MIANSQDLPQLLAQKLHPIYIVSGDEPLQVGEASDAIRAAARKQQYTERHVLHVDKGFDWSEFLAVSNSLSLFAERQIIELRMPGGKPGDKGARALIDYAENPAADTLVLLVCGKVDKATQRSNWFSKLEKKGVFIQLWPIELRQLPNWIQQRSRSKGMTLTRSAVQLIVDRVEGNMLAAAQEIDKLSLLYGASEIDEQAVLEAVSDSARYDVYGLVDTALAGDIKRVARTLDGLRAEGVEPVLIIWALAREIRSLLPMVTAVDRGVRPEQAVAQAAVWPKRKPLVTASLKRHNVQSLQELLQHASKIDRIIKGLMAGNVWDELLQLTSGIAGVHLFPELVSY